MKKNFSILEHIQGRNGRVICASVHTNVNKLPESSSDRDPILIRIPSVHKTASKFMQKWNKN